MSIKIYVKYVKNNRDFYTTKMNLPTGALDSKSGKDLLGCLKNANEQENATILMVTHDGYTASYAKEVYFLKDGKIHSRLTQKDSRKAFFEEIMTMLAVMGGEGE